MTRPMRTAILLSFLAVATTACAVRLGGPSPEGYDVVAISELRLADAVAVAEKITSAGAEIVLLAAERQDSAWFVAVAGNARLGLSGPGATTGRGYAFLTNLEILGDTSLVLPVPDGGSVHMHDALYKIDDDRNIDLMIVRIDAPEVRAGVRTLLNYMATDVPADAPLVLAFDGPTPELADSAVAMMLATLGDGSECREEPQSAEPSLRLMYGPSARVRCLSARNLPGDLPGIVARLEVSR